MNATGIEWTDFTANPLKYRDPATNKIVWACAKKSAGCQHCYAETLAKRFDRGGPFNLPTVERLRPFVDDDELRKLIRSKKLAGKRVFVCDMTDLFGEWVPNAVIDRIFAAFALRPDVTFQVLTKRADRLAAYMAECFTTDNFCGPMTGFRRPPDDRIAGSIAAYANLPPWKLRATWPLPNVWLGTSVENQAAADERIPHLLRAPAAVRFLSCEPLLGPVDLRPWIANIGEWDGEGAYPPIHWCITGGESGPGARPCNFSWVKDIVEQCQSAGVPCFVKQLGAVSVMDINFPAPKWERSFSVPVVAENGRVTLRLADKKGGDIAEWPADLRVRQFPEAHG